jgi:hypothetical protein
VPFRKSISLLANLAVLRESRAAIALCALLLTAQGSAAWHELDLAGHAQSDPCEVCLVLAGSAAGVLPESAGPAAVPALVSPAPFRYADAPELCPVAYRAIRAPPLSRLT